MQALCFACKLPQPLLSVISFPTAVQRYNKKWQFVPFVQRFGAVCDLVYHKLLIFSMGFDMSQMTKKSSFSSDEATWMPYPFTGLNFSTWRGKYFFYATQIEKRREGRIYYNLSGRKAKECKVCHECHVS